MLPAVIFLCLGFAGGLAMGWYLRAKVEVATESEPKSELRQLKSRQVIYAARIRSLYIELAHLDAKLSMLRAAGIDTDRIPDVEPVIDTRLASIIGALDPGDVDGTDDQVEDLSGFMSILPANLADEHEANLLDGGDGGEMAHHSVEVPPDPVSAEGSDRTSTPEDAPAAANGSDGGGQLAKRVAQALASEALRGGDAAQALAEVTQLHADPAPDVAGGDDVDPVAGSRPGGDGDRDGGEVAVSLSLIGAEADRMDVDLREPDDLTRIWGIGPKLASIVNEAGICTFAELASLDADGIDALEDRLGSFKGRIRRDDWVGSARQILEADPAPVR